MSKSFGGLIDLDRHPVDAPDRERGQDLVTRQREALRDDGLSRLDGFLRPELLAA